MNSTLRPGDARFPLSTKDTILLILFGFSSLLGFALSFSLLHSDGRPYLFAGCVLVCAACLAAAEKKKEIVVGTVGFILLRVLWAVVVKLVRHL